MASVTSLGVFSGSCWSRYRARQRSVRPPRMPETWGRTVTGSVIALTGGGLGRSGRHGWLAYWPHSRRRAARRAPAGSGAFGRIRPADPISRGPGHNVIQGHNVAVPTPEPPATRGWTRELAGSFQTAAAGYARFRPGYPPAAVGAALPPDARRVLDLGAGTGKLTEALVDRGLDVVAVEPLPGMLAELAWRFPSVTAVLGSAEAIPLRDGHLRRRRGGPGLSLVRPRAGARARWPGCCGPAGRCPCCGTTTTRPIRWSGRSRRN